MKWFVLCFVTVIGCGTTRYQLVTPCGKSSKSDIVAAMSALVAQEGFTVSLINENIGVLQASTPEEFSIWTGLNTTRQWSLTMRGDTVLMMAKTVSYSKNVFGATTGGAETYYNDNAHSDWTWYWNVRNGMATLCENQPVIIETTVR